LFNYEKEKPLRDYLVYFGSTLGKISVYDDGVVIQTGKKHIPVRTNYVEALNRAGGEPILGKVTVELSYFDMFGNREVLEVRMRENDLAALKQDIGR